MLKAAVLTISDRCSRNEMVDKSGKHLVDALKSISMNSVVYEIIPDEEDLILAKLKEYADIIQVDIILTTGGTGISPRDVTPEATEKIIEKDLPGIPELIRRESYKKNINAVLSRLKAGIRGKSIIINFPGNLAAVQECFQIIKNILPHAIDMIAGKGH